MEFICFHIKDEQGIVYQMATISAYAVKHRLAPKVLYEAHDWLAAALLPLRREK